MDKDKKSSCTSCAVKGGAFLGATALLVGTIGAHVISEKIVTAGGQELWEIATRYHFIHAVALVAAGGWFCAKGLTCCTKWITMFLFFGTLLFSSSLYCLAAGGPSWMSYVTPVGSVLMILGWVMLFMAAMKADSCCGGGKCETK